MSMRKYFEKTDKWVVTFRYPLEPLEPPKELRGKPEIDPDLCIGCGACAQACPPNAITVHTDYDEGLKKVRIFYGRCIYCGRCWEVCPEGAIKLTNFFEMATPNKEDLVYEVVLPLHRCPRCGNYLEFTERQVHRAYTLLARLPEERRKELLERMFLCRDCRRQVFSLEEFKNRRRDKYVQASQTPF